MWFGFQSNKAPRPTPVRRLPSVAEDSARVTAVMRSGEGTSTATSLVRRKSSRRGSRSMSKSI